MPESSIKSPATETPASETIGGAPLMARSLRHGWDSQISRPQPSRAQILFHHFFRRFFDNDTLPIPGDPETAVVRALSFVAVPSLMFAFWLLPHYPGRQPWVMEGDRYFFVYYSIKSKRYSNVLFHGLA